MKKNQRRLWEHIALFFQIPAIAADHEQWERVQTVEKGHGRLEGRTLAYGSGMDALDWPDAKQIIRRTTERPVIKTDKRSTEGTDGITSLSPDAVTAADLETLWQGDWSIANQKHHVRDGTFGEDAEQVHRGAAPQALAACRNASIDVFRWCGWTNMVDVIRRYRASVNRALTLMGALPG